MRVNSLGAIALFLAAGIGIACLTSCSNPNSRNLSNTSNPPGTPPPGGGPAESNGPHIYVAANSPNGALSNPGSTYGFSVSQDGQLTQISGFPLSYAVDGVISGNYVFSRDSDGVHIDTYKINSDGSLAKVQSFDDTQASAKACSQCTPGWPLLVDRSGLTLYASAGFLDGGDWNAYLQTFAIDPSSGAIRYVSANMPIESRDWGQVFGSFSGDDAFLYGTNETPQTTAVFFANRSSDGSLSEPSSTWDSILKGLSYQPSMSMAIGADTTNHLAVAIQASDPGGGPLPAIQLASFTINSDGSLTTTNTSAQMPQTSSGAGSVSPDGTLIATFGDMGGIQVFQFNGANPITSVGSMLATDAITQLSWDKQNHLYALSKSQKLYVFNVSSTSASPAPGSPHSITNAFNVLVQP